VPSRLAFAQMQRDASKFKRKLS